MTVETVYLDHDEVTATVTVDGIQGTVRLHVRAGRLVTPTLSLDGWMSPSLCRLLGPDRRWHARATELIEAVRVALSGYPDIL